jgi:hypothetical protein
MRTRLKLGRQRSCNGVSASEQLPAEHCSDILIIVLQLTLRDTKHVEMRGLGILSGLSAVSPNQNTAECV